MELVVIRQFLILVVLAVLVGCSSVESLDGSPLMASADNCSVTVYATLKQAELNGPIEELCVVTGTSSGSFSHTVATAVEKHKDKACQCGATNAYIQSRAEGDLGIANVTMVGFRYIDKKPSPVVTGETLERAGICQSKGGVWVNDSCYISVD